MLLGERAQQGTVPIGLRAGSVPLRSQRSLREEDVSRGERRDRGGVWFWVSGIVGR